MSKCHCNTLSGKQCARKTKEGSKYCWQHTKCTSKRSGKTNKNLKQEDLVKFTMLKGKFKPSETDLFNKEFADFAKYETFRKELDFMGIKLEPKKEPKNFYEHGLLLEVAIERQKLLKEGNQSLKDLNKALKPFSNIIVH